MRSFRNLRGSFSFNSIFTQTITPQPSKTVSITLAVLSNRVLIIDRVWPIRCSKTLKSLFNTQNKASLRLIDLYSFKKRTLGWAFSNRKTAVDRLKNITKSRHFGVNNKLRRSMRKRINLKETVRYLHRLRRSSLRRLSLTKITIVRSHLLQLARLFLMFSRGSKRPEHKIH